MSGIFTTYGQFLSQLPYPWVDAGAYKGEFIDACLALCPDIRTNVRANVFIEAFEPQPRRAAKLVKKYAGNSKVRVRAMALGAEPAKVPLHITVGNAFSSVLPPLTNLRENHGSRAEVAKIVTVEQVRLDSILETSPGFMKLDIQGAELDALHGCGKLLAGVGAILVELDEVPRYQNQPRAEQIHHVLSTRGFSLKGRWDHGFQGGPAVCDAFYARDIF